MWFAWWDMQDTIYWFHPEDSLHLRPSISMSINRPAPCAGLLYSGNPMTYISASHTLPHSLCHCLCPCKLWRWLGLTGQRTQPLGGGRDEGWVLQGLQRKQMLRLELTAIHLRMCDSQTPNKFKTGLARFYIYLCIMNQWEVRGWLSRDVFLILPSGAQGSNSRCQAWRQVP